MVQHVEKDHTRPAQPQPGKRILETDDSARQGPWGRPVLMVLIGSVLLLGVYLVSLLVWSGSQSPDHPSQATSRQAAQPPASSANTSRVPAANPAYPTPSVPSTGSTGNQTNR
jgi:cytochrome c-type biogenesis protein CcmH/NrfG